MISTISDARIQIRLYILIAIGQSVTNISIRPIPNVGFIRFSRLFSHLVLFLSEFPYFLHVSHEVLLVVNKTLLQLNIYLYLNYKVTRLVGFEPTNDRIKTCCVDRFATPIHSLITYQLQLYYLFLKL